MEMYNEKLLMQQLRTCTATVTANAEVVNAAAATAPATTAGTLLLSHKLTHDPQIHPQPSNLPRTNNN